MCIRDRYQALQTANVSLGICQEISRTVPLDDSLRMAYRSVMGVEIPMVSLEEKGQTNIPYGLSNTNSMLDRAYERFNEVKRLTAELAEVENSVYRLADAIKKTQKRANALKNIMICLLYTSPPPPHTRPWSSPSARFSVRFVS